MFRGRKSFLSWLAGTTAVPAAFQTDWIVVTILTRSFQFIGCSCAIIGVFILALPVPIVLNRLVQCFFRQIIDKFDTRILSWSLPWSLTRSVILSQFFTKNKSLLYLTGLIVCLHPSFQSFFNPYCIFFPIFFCILLNELIIGGYTPCLTPCGGFGIINAY